MIWWYWILFGFGLLVAELLLPSGFFIFFFGVGALLTGLLVLSGWLSDPGLQWIVCTVTSIALALFFRKFLMGEWAFTGSFNNTPEGKEVVVTEMAQPGGLGACEYRGSRWTIRNKGEGVLATGDRAVVENREGLTLIVRRVS